MPRANYPKDKGTLAWYRIRAGYRRQTDLAERVGVSQATVSKWEAGCMPPTDRENHLATLATALGKTERTIVRAVELTRSIAAATIPGELIRLDAIHASFPPRTASSHSAVARPLSRTLTGVPA